MDSEGQSSHEPDLNAPDRYLSAYTQDIESVEGTLAGAKAKNDLINKIIEEFKEGTPKSSEWSLKPLPSGRTVPTEAVQATLEPYGKVWIIATTQKNIVKGNTYTRQDLYAAMLLMQQNDILGTWAKTERAKSGGYRYYIIAKVTDRFRKCACVLCR